MRIPITAIDEAEMLEILNDANARLNNGLKYSPLAIVPQEKQFLSLEYARFVLSVFPAVRFGEEGELSRQEVEEAQRYYYSNDRRRAALLAAIANGSAIVEDLNDANYTVIPERKKGGPPR